MPVYLTVKIAPSSSAEFAASCLLTVISAVLFSSSTIRCLLFVSSALTFPVSSPPADDDLTLSDFITPFSISKFHTDESFSNESRQPVYTGIVDRYQTLFRLEFNPSSGPLPAGTVIEDDFSTLAGWEFKPDSVHVFQGTANLAGRLILIRTNTAGK